MEKIKHIIATRFLCFNGNLGDKVLSKEYIDRGMELMSKYLVPTLENQTNQNFELVLLVHDKLNLRGKTSKFVGLSDKLTIKVVRYGQFDNYVRMAAKDCENLIVTRIDYDDLVWNGAVDDIQKRIGKAPLYVYGYNRGFAWQEGTSDLRLFLQDYRGKGNMSVFQSCVINTSLLGPVGIHPYRWNHTKPLESSVCQGINKNDILFERNFDTDAFIWVRHENTSSGLIFPAYVNKKAYMDKDDMIRIFGVKIIE